MQPWHAHHRPAPQSLQLHSGRTFDIPPGVGPTIDVVSESLSSQGSACRGVGYKMHYAATEGSDSPSQQSSSSHQSFDTTDYGPPPDPSKPSDDDPGFNGPEPAKPFDPLDYGPPTEDRLPFLSPRCPPPSEDTVFEEAQPEYPFLGPRPADAPMEVTQLDDFCAETQWGPLSESQLEQMLD